MKAKNFCVTAVINLEVMVDDKLKARPELLQTKLASYLVLQTEYLMRGMGSCPSAVAFAPSFGQTERKRGRRMRSLG